MPNQSDEQINLYVSFVGVLLGFSIALITLLLPLTTGKYKESPLFEYAITAFVVSALGYLENIEWFIHFIKTKKEVHYKIGAKSFYLGYLFMILGVAYILKLFEIKLALYIIYVYLIYTIIFAIRDFYVAINKGRNLIDIIVSPIIIFVYTLIVWFTLIK